MYHLYYQILIAYLKFNDKEAGISVYPGFYFIMLLERDVVDEQTGVVVVVGGVDNAEADGVGSGFCKGVGISLPACLAVEVTTWSCGTHGGISVSDFQEFRIESSWSAIYKEETIVSFC